MELHIRHMVSTRCKMVVQYELEKLGINALSIELGVVKTEQDLDASQREALNCALKKAGLELIEDKRSILVEQIKSVIIELIHNSEEPMKLTYSNYIGQKLNHSYTYLANVFSGVQGFTITHFIISHKIERAKEMLVYEDLSLKEISDRLDYSSIAHLSGQFKKITGLTPSQFKSIKRLSPRENVGSTASIN